MCPLQPKLWEFIPRILPKVEPVEVARSMVDVVAEEDTSRGTTVAYVSRCIVYVAHCGGIRNHVLCSLNGTRSRRRGDCC